MNLGTVFSGLASNLQITCFDALFIRLVVHLSLGENFHLQERRKRVDHRDPHTVKSAGHLVGMIVELTAGVQFGHHHFYGRDLFGFVNSGRYTTPIVFHAYTAIGENNHLDPVAITGHGFVDTVVHHFIYQVVKSGCIDIADIHCRSFSNSLQTL